MRFTGTREIGASIDEVWAALHDPAVLAAAIPGCEQMTPAGVDRYDATLVVRVGPISDTYRGSFAIRDRVPGESLAVTVEGKGRAGRLSVALQVRLVEGLDVGTTVLAYDATAIVGGFVARLGTATLTVAGGHLTGFFFGGLDRALRARTRRLALV